MEKLLTDDFFLAVGLALLMWAPVLFLIINIFTSGEREALRAMVVLRYADEHPQWAQNNFDLIVSATLKYEEWARRELKSQQWIKGKKGQPLPGLDS